MPNQTEEGKSIQGHLTGMNQIREKIKWQEIYSIYKYLFHNWWQAQKLIVYLILKTNLYIFFFW